MSRKWRSFAQYAAALSLGIALWAAYVQLANVPEFLLPGPVPSGARFWEMLVTGEVLGHFVITATRVLGGFGLGLILGLIAGYLLWQFPKWESAVMPYLVAAQVAPKIALAPLFILWFGLGVMSKLVLILSMVFFPVFIGTLLGLRSVPRDARALAKVIGLKGLSRVRHIDAVYALPEIFSGIRVGMIQALIGGIVAEWLSGNSGLGFLLTFTADTYDAAGMIATIAYTSVMGFSFYAVLGYVEHRFLFWHTSKAGASAERSTA